MPQWQSQMTGSAIHQSALSASRQSTQYLGQASDQVEKERTLRPGGLCSVPATLTPSSGVLLSPTRPQLLQKTAELQVAHGQRRRSNPLTLSAPHPICTPATRTWGHCLGDQLRQSAQQRHQGGKLLLNTMPVTTKSPPGQPLCCWRRPSQSRASSGRVMHMNLRTSGTRPPAPAGIRATASDWTPQTRPVPPAARILRPDAQAAKSGDRPSQQSLSLMPVDTDCLVPEPRIRGDVQEERTLRPGRLCTRGQ